MHKFLLRLFEFDGIYGGGGTGVVAVEVAMKSESEDNEFLDECVNVLSYEVLLYVPRSPKIYIFSR